MKSTLDFVCHIANRIPGREATESKRACFVQPDRLLKIAQQPHLKTRIQKELTFWVYVDC